MGRRGGWDAATGELRCGTCGKLLAERVQPPYRLRCGKCKSINEGSVQRTVKTWTEVAI